MKGLYEIPENENIKEKQPKLKVPTTNICGKCVTVPLVKRCVKTARWSNNQQFKILRLIAGDAHTKSDCFMGNWWAASYIVMSINHIDTDRHYTPISFLFSGNKIHFEISNSLFGLQLPTTLISSMGDLRLSGSVIRKSRFIFMKERRTIRQKSGCLNHLIEQIFQVNIQMQGVDQ